MIGPSQMKVVLNVDDVGMCHGANQAFLELSRAGRVDSGSVMMPCPWASEIMDWAKGDDTIRVGIHLTLNAEKRHYRWRPLIGCSQSTGLVDGDGYFWRTVADLRQNADKQAVEDELRAQIEAFLITGVVPTHMDGHMGAILTPEFSPIYLKLAEEYGLAALYPRHFSSYGPSHNFTAIDSSVVDEIGQEFERRGRTLADRVLETPWHLRSTVEKRYSPVLDAIGPGLNHVSLHPNCPGDIEAIEPNSARIRTEEYDYLASDGFGHWLGQQSFERGTLTA